MSRKLTLTIDERVIKFAKLYARRTHQSISSIVERYFSRLQSEVDVEGLSSEATGLYGVLADTPLPDKRTIRADFHEKDTH